MTEPGSDPMPPWAPASPYVPPSGRAGQPAGPGGPTWTGAAWDGSPGWPAPYGCGVPPRTNPWSVAAIVTGLVGLVPIAVGTGIVALVQLRERPERGRALAVGGLVAAGCWSVMALLVAVVLGLGFAGYGPGPGSAVAGTVAQAGGATVGTCLRTRQDGPGTEAVPCGPTHDEEVYRVTRLPGGAWPGDGEVLGRADDVCYDGFEGYVGAAYEESAYDYAFYAPDEGEWTSGERRVVCVIVPSDDADLTSSAAGTRR